MTGIQLDKHSALVEVAPHYLIGVVLCGLLFLAGCNTVVSSASVKTLSDREICTTLGEMEFKQDVGGKGLLVSEIKEREVPTGECETLADERLFDLRNREKDRLCKQLGRYYYVGDSGNYYKVSKKVEDKGYYDDQCVEIAEFYIRRIEIKKEAREERRDRIRAAGEALSQMNRPGSYGNPIHVKID